MTIKKQYLGVGALALAHLAVTFATDRYVFTVPATENLTDYIICKGIVFAILLAFYYGLYLVIFAGKTEILFSALPYLAVIAAVCFFKLRQGFLSNDEFLIYQNAVSLTHYTWFTYITVYFYIVALMLIPHMTVAENIYLTREAMAHGRIDYQKMNQDSQAILDL
ncbi:MAG: hypothetical protein IJ073_02975, partial [Lachnospiraceae bacterium]|nr:hypothetical protein [Lachnospiraceae bacterium]